MNTTSATMLITLSEGLMISLRSGTCGSRSGVQLPPPMLILAWHLSITANAIVIVANARASALTTVCMLSASQSVKYRE